MVYNFFKSHNWCLESVESDLYHDTSRARESGLSRDRNSHHSNVDQRPSFCFVPSMVKAKPREGKNSSDFHENIVNGKSHHLKIE
jgi:hypothetical protein